MASHGKKLTDEHRQFLVVQMAQFHSPRESCDALEEKFGIKITTEACRHYNPYTKRGRQRLAPRWKTLFNESRERFLTRIEEDIPDANKSVRVRKLSKAADKYERAGNYMAMAKMLEQIAKEMGGFMSNRREITGPGGGPINYRDVGDMTDEQLDEELDRLLRLAQEAEESTKH